MSLYLAHPHLTSVMIFFVIGILILLPAAYLETWPSTTATVVNATVRITETCGSGPCTMSSYQNVKYVYDVEGLTYSASLNTSSNSTQYYYGSTFVLYYNPENPTQTIYQKVLHIAEIIFPLVGLVIIAIGVLVLISWKKTTARGKAESDS